MTKFLDETGLRTYNEALQAKIVENFATKEYVNSIAGNAGLTFKIVDRLPSALAGQTINLADSMGVDLSGAKLIMNFPSSFVAGSSTEYPNLVICSGGEIHYNANSTPRIVVNNTTSYLDILDSSQNLTRIFQFPNTYLISDYSLPSDFGIVTYLETAQYSTEISYIQVELAGEMPEEGVIYLVPVSGGAAGNNIYEEYMWINDTWECLGSTNMDLSNYYTKDAAEAREQEVDTILEGNDAEMATLAAQITSLSNQIADLRIQLGDEMGTAYRLQNTTVSINEVSMQVGSSNSAAQLKSDGNTLEVVTNGATTLKADGEKLYANNISTDGSIEAGSHKQQIFNTGSEIRTGWFYTGGGQ